MRETHPFIAVAVRASRAAGVGVTHFFEEGLGFMHELDEADLDAGKRARVKVLEPMVGPAVLRKIEAAASASVLHDLESQFSFESFFSAGRESGDITDDLLASSLPVEAQVLLPADLVIPWLVEDESGWWQEETNVGHLAEVVSGLLEHDQSLRSDFVTAIDLEAVFEKMMAAGPDMTRKLARFAASLRAGVKGGTVFDGRLLDVFTVEELVGHADAGAVWDFCRDALRKAAESATRSAAEGGEPPRLVTCKCGGRAAFGTKFCPACGEMLRTEAPAAARS